MPTRRVVSAALVFGVLGCDSIGRMEHAARDAQAVASDVRDELHQEVTITTVLKPEGISWVVIPATTPTTDAELVRIVRKSLATHSRERIVVILANRASVVR